MRSVDDVDVALAVQLRRAADEADDFECRGCSRVTTAECNNLSDDGKSSQGVANVALAFAGVALITTAVIAIGFTNWRGDRRSGRAAPGGFAITF